MPIEYYYLIWCNYLPDAYEQPPTAKCVYATIEPACH